METKQKHKRRSTKVINFLKDLDDNLVMIKAKLEAKHGEVSDESIFFELFQKGYEYGVDLILNKDLDKELELKVNFMTLKKTYNFEILKIDESFISCGKEAVSSLRDWMIEYKYFWNGKIDVDMAMDFLMQRWNYIGLNSNEFVKEYENICNVVYWEMNKAKLEEEQGNAAWYRTIFEEAKINRNIFII